MKRRQFIRHAALAVPAAMTMTGCKPANTSQALSKDRLNKAKAAMLCTQRAPWEQGVAMMALLETGDDDLIVPMAYEAVLRSDKEGRLGMVGGASTITDPASNGPGVLHAFLVTGDTKLKEAADRQYDFLKTRAPRSNNGTLYHFSNGQQVWSDSMYMAPPFLAYYGDVEEAVKQVRGFMGYLWNEESHMMSHMWDDKGGTFKRKAFWGGGNGWSAASLALLIDCLPASMSEVRDEFILRANQLLDGCIRHIRSDGLFHDVIDEPSTFVETNLSQMLAFSIYKGAKAGWIDESYVRVAHRMRAGALEKVDAYGRVQDACGSPTFDKPGTSTEAQAFFVMMETAYRNL